LIVFDVNETLSDMAPMGKRFADVGAPELLAKIWFAGASLGHPWREPRGHAHRVDQLRRSDIPGYFAAPDVSAPDLTALAEQIASAHGHSRPNRSARLHNLRLMGNQQHDRLDDHGRLSEPVSASLGGPAGGGKT
jgi:hypothetical protein